VGFCLDEASTVSPGATPLESTLTEMSASVDSNGFTGSLSYLESTLTENTGGGEYNASFNPRNQALSFAAETSLLICQIGADRLAPRLETCDNLAVIESTVF
jgi:hypothetical protein